ncbi:hypothetical protein PIB30_085181, partial [Stylosanthes scabra]|nr:hypothetical protein [Stylosanthes scabra]
GVQTPKGYIRNVEQKVTANLGDSTILVLVKYHEVKKEAHNTREQKDQPTQAQENKKEHHLASSPSPPPPSFSAKKE